MMASRAYIKNPCLICNTSVRSNQNAALYIGCQQWCHVKCGVPISDYERDIDWTCNKCIFQELPSHDHYESETLTPQLDDIDDMPATSRDLDEARLNNM